LRKEENEKKKDKKNDGFMSKLSETIINNIQIKIKNVHFRYEDLSDKNVKI
jgi:hypothetical protein